MADEECPHGLDPSWCTFCKQRAAGVPPTGVRRAPAASRPRSRVSRPARPRAAAAAATASPPRSPADALAKLRKVLFHASAYGAWPAIADLGLRTPAQLMSDAADPRRRAVRDSNVELVDPSGHHIVIRDQRPMVRAGIDAHLDGITMAEWLEVLNERSFFFARQKELTTMVARYQATEGQDVVVFDAAKLLAAAGRVEVATVIPCEPVSWTRCPCRNRATFVPINDYAGPTADIQEVTVVGGIESVRDLIVRVVRYHPDRTTEVLVA